MGQAMGSQPETRDRHGGEVQQLPGSGVSTPGAVKPRGGARQSALGPLLSRLRAEDKL
jgi:hypothetical protein